MTEAREMARNRNVQASETQGGDLLLVGKCAECHGDVARVIEDS